MKEENPIYYTYTHPSSIKIFRRRNGDWSYLINPYDFMKWNNKERKRDGDTEYRRYVDRDRYLSLIEAGGLIKKLTYEAEKELDKNND